MHFTRTSRFIQTSPLLAKLAFPSPKGEGKENRRFGRGEVWAGLFSFSKVHNTLKSL